MRSCLSEFNPSLSHALICSSSCVWVCKTLGKMLSVSTRYHRCTVWQHDWYSYRLNKYLHRKFIERVFFLHFFWDWTFVGLLSLLLFLFFFSVISLLFGLEINAVHFIHCMKWVVIFLNADNLFGADSIVWCVASSMFDTP